MDEARVGICCGAHAKHNRPLEGGPQLRKLM